LEATSRHASVHVKQPFRFVATGDIAMGGRTTMGCKARGENKGGQSICTQQKRDSYNYTSQFMSLTTDTYPKNIV
jgi:hypothetical protein